MSDIIRHTEQIIWTPTKIKPRDERTRYLLKYRNGIVYGWWLYDGFYSCQNYQERYRLKSVTHYASVKGPIK